MKTCELCKNPARIYCESDQANLCWICDTKVHSANFLVAKHSRTLLCHVCQSPTPWNAAGEKIGRTICACEHCIFHGSTDGVDDIVRTAVVEEQIIDEDETDSDSDFDDEEDDDEEDGDEGSVDADEGDDEDNQVVPWSLTSPPPAASSSSSEESSSGEPDVSSKRMREDVADLCSDDDTGSSSFSRKKNYIQKEAAMVSKGVEGAFVDSLSFNRPPKTLKIEANRKVGVAQQTLWTQSRDSYSKI